MRVNKLTSQFPGDPEGNRDKYAVQSDRDVTSDTSNHHPHLALRDVRPTLFDINVDICPFWAFYEYLEDTDTCWRILSLPTLTGNWCLGGWLYWLLCWLAICFVLKIQLSRRYFVPNSLAHPVVCSISQPLHITIHAKRQS